MRVLGLARSSTENWQCQAWHRGVPPRLIDLFYPPTGPGQESAHFSLCSDLPSARLTKEILLSRAGQAGVKLGVSRVCTHTPSLLPHFSFLSPKFSLIPTLALMLSLHLCSYLFYSVFLPSFLPPFFPPSLLPFLPRWFVLFVISVPHFSTLGPNTFSPVHKDFLSLPIPMPTLLSPTVEKSPLYSPACSFGQKSDKCLHYLPLLLLLQALSKEAIESPTLSTIVLGTMPVLDPCQGPLPVARLTNADAQKTESGPWPKPVGGWLWYALMLRLATQSLGLGFLFFSPIS